ncbi:MAG TPA: 4'-phosphopantetheinyl transferase superfamily protein [Solirubrobacterales bacterium]|nr:4'-phosphopantetheinyl transferase superfamily protein [Solirubrobacterales bacterium]
MIDGVHIWRAALDEAGWPGVERLPPQERERAASFLREDACRRWAAARWALRRVLERYLDEPAAAIELEVEAGGRPRLRSDPGLEFSLSHSNGLALVAVAGGHEVGVDVELVAPRRDLEALAERALGVEDAAAVREAPEPRRTEVFYAAWTRHEARLKCIGAGLTGASGQFTLSAGGNRPLTVENFDIEPCYAAAVAVAAPEVGRVECRSLRAG